MDVISWLREEWAKAGAMLAAQTAAAPAAAAPPPTPWPTFAERLAGLFEQFRTDEIDLDEYAEGIEFEEVRCEEAIMLHHQCEFDMSSTQFEADLEDLWEELEECRWRLWWIAKQRHLGRIRQDEFPADGKWARFDYIDHRGIASMAFYYHVGKAWRLHRRL